MHSHPTIPLPENTVIVSSSVIIPLTHGSKQLEALIPNLLQQAGVAELILVGSGEKLAEFASNGDATRVTVVPSSSPRLLDLLKVGCQTAQGEFCTLLGSDSPQDIDRIPDLIQGLKQSSDLGFACISRQGNPHATLPDLFRHNPAEGPIVIRRGFLDTIGELDSEVAGIAIWELCLRIAEQHAAFILKGSPQPKLHEGGLALRKLELTRTQMKLKVIQRLAHGTSALWWAEICQDLLEQVQSCETALWEVKTTQSLIESVLATEQKLKQEAEQELALERETKRTLQQAYDNDKRLWASTEEHLQRERELAIAQKDAAFQDFSNRETALRQELTSIYSSKAWKLITMLRLLKNGIKYVLRLGR